VPSASLARLVGGEHGHHLPVRHGREQRYVEPLGPDGDTFGVAARAEVTTLARERQLIPVRAGVTADACDAVIEDPIGEELVGDLRDDRAPRAVLAREALVVDRLQTVQVIRHQPKERRRLGPSGFVDAARRARGSAIGAPSHGSAEHTPDSGADRRHSVAPRAVSTQHSCGAGLTMLAVDERTDQSRGVKQQVVRSQQKLALCRQPGFAVVAGVDYANGFYLSIGYRRQ